MAVKARAILLLLAPALFAADPTALTPNQTLGRQLPSGDTHDYQVTLRAGEYARIDLFQYTINVGVECIGPDGEQRFEVDSRGIDDYEIAELIADANELPARAEIESAARRVYDVLASRNRNLADEKAAAANAGAMLLAPAASKIAGKRLLIVAEGVLQYLPFAYLPDPADPAVPLIINHELVSAPSASVIAVLRNDRHLRRPGLRLPIPPPSLQPRRSRRDCPPHSAELHPQSPRLGRHARSRP